MNATIVKSSTTVNVLDDFTLDLKNDGGLDTAVIRFHSTNNALLERYDRVTFNGRTWRVASQPTARINTESSPNWLYTVELIEKAALLKGYPMPNFTFTQNLAQTKTFRNALEEGCKKVQTLFVGQTERFSIKASPTVTLSGIAPDDKFEGFDFYQFLKYYAEILDAKFEIDENDIIDFVPLNTYTDTIAPDMKVIELSKPTDDYATDIIMDITNADAGTTNIDHYPHKDIHIHLAPLDITKSIGDVKELLYRDFDNLRFTLPHKIKKIHKITLWEKDPYEANDFVTVLNYGQYVFEQDEWRTLPQNSLWSWLPQTPWASLRENSIYYEFGNNELQNLQALRKHAPFDSSTTGFAWSVFLKVEYEIYEEIQIARSSGIILDGNYTFTQRQSQNQSSASLKAETARMEAELRNKQTAYYNVRWRSDTIPSVRNRVTVLGNQTLITWLRAERVGNQYDISARLATQYNKRSPLTKIISENRIFEIPSKQITLRKIVWNQNVKFSMGYNTAPTVPTNKFNGYNYLLFLNIDDESTIANPSMVALFAQFAYRTPFDDTNAIAVMIPYNVTINGDTVIVVAKMTSNTSVDFQRDAAVTGGEANGTKTSARSAIVTDANGEVDGVQFRFIPATSDTLIASNVMLREVYPIVTQGFFSTGFYQANSFTKKYIEIDNEINTNKDRREQLQFEKRYKFSGINTTTINTENIIAASKLRSAGVKPTLKVTINDTEYTVNTESEHLDRYTKIYFTPPTTGTLNIIKVFFGSLLCFQKTFNENIAATTSRYITLHIEE